jgi:hypothetical protein
VKVIQGLVRASELSLLRPIGNGRYESVCQCGWVSAIGRWRSTLEATEAHEATHQNGAPESEAAGGTVAPAHAPARGGSGPTVGPIVASV